MPSTATSRSKFKKNLKNRPIKQKIAKILKFTTGFWNHTDIVVNKLIIKLKLTALKNINIFHCHNPLENEQKRLIYI